MDRKLKEDKELFALGGISADKVMEDLDKVRDLFLSEEDTVSDTTVIGTAEDMTAIAKRSLDDRERVLDCLNKIDFSSRHLLNLLNDVLDMSKNESGKLARVNEPFDLVELLQGAGVNPAAPMR